MRWMIFIFVFLFSQDLKTTLNKTKIYISKMNVKMDFLAKEIKKKEKELQKIQTQIKKLNEEIKKLKIKLKNSNQILNELNDLKKGELTKLNSIQEEINNFLSSNYYLNTKQIDNINDLINYELMERVLKIYSLKIQKLLKNKAKIEENIKKTNKQIQEILNAKKALELKKEELKSLLEKEKKQITILKQKKEEYKKELFTMLKKAKTLQTKLKKLQVIKLPKNTSYIKPTYSYKGIKTIPPVRGKIIKKFGSYIDPIYKIKIYNDSITIKPYKKNAFVRSIMPGKVIYIGESNGKKIIVIKHKKNIFSIYANLSKISPLLKKGKYVKRGQIIARVKDTLEFEVTYKEKPINPLKVVKF